jgi:peroxiredoxin
MAKRSIFIIDRRGVIRWTWERSRDQPLPDYDLVLAEAKKITADA